MKKVEKIGKKWKKVVLAFLLLFASVNYFIIEFEWLAITALITRRSSRLVFLLVGAPVRQAAAPPYVVSNAGIIFGSMCKFYHRNESRPNKNLYIVIVSSSSFLSRRSLGPPNLRMACGICTYVMRICTVAHTYVNFSIKSLITTLISALLWKIHQI